MSSCNCNQNDYLPPCDNGCANPKPPCPPPYLPPICPPENPCPPRPGCGNNTPWYGLPQWKASDVTSWLMQMNGAMLRIDTILHDLALRTGINGLPDDLVTTVSKLCGDVEQMKCTMGELTNKQANVELLMQNINTQFSAMKTDVASLQLTMTNFDTRLMAVDSKANALKNDVTLIKTDINMLSSTVKNLQSNFTQFQMEVQQSIAGMETRFPELEKFSVAHNDIVFTADASTITQDLLSVDNASFPSGGLNMNGFQFTIRKFSIGAETNIGLSSLYIRTPNAIQLENATNSTSSPVIHIDLSKFNIPKLNLSSATYPVLTKCRIYNNNNNSTAGDVCILQITLKYLEDGRSITGLDIKLFNAGNSPDYPKITAWSGVVTDVGFLQSFSNTSTMEV